MDARLNSLVVVGLAVLTTAAFVPTSAAADDHPQEVLDLISAHRALAMKVRPLQDRVVAARSQGENSTGFRPDGVPLRAQGLASTADGNTAAEGRVSERLRHKDRAAATSDVYDRIESRLSALDERARSELERISTSGFGLRSSAGAAESADVGFGDGRRGARLPTRAAPRGAPAVGTAQAPDSEAISAARRALATLEREYAALEREVRALEPR